MQDAVSLKIHSVPQSRCLIHDLFWIIEFAANGSIALAVPMDLTTHIVRMTDREMRCRKQLYHPLRRFLAVSDVSEPALQKGLRIF
jgi:hypothetical protein